MKYLSITFWLNRYHPVRHGFSPENEEETATFRFGPIVVGWELVDHS